MKEITLEQEARLLLNNEIKVTDHRSGFVGMTGLVRKVMADGRTLEVQLDCPNSYTDGAIVMMDVSLVSEINERTHYAKGEPDLGPVANSVIQDHK
tara:strand:+ start:250 stop:537 length:288 start_codon:yes stop_codon:yes gene_type:complete